MLGEQRICISTIFGPSCGREEAAASQAPVLGDLVSFSSCPFHVPSQWSQVVCFGFCEIKRKQGFPHVIDLTLISLGKCLQSARLVYSMINLTGRGSPGLLDRGVRNHSVLEKVPSPVPPPAESNPTFHYKIEQCVNNSSNASRLDSG